ncbi:hypothetical protein D0Z03_000293 [Geotrichum reessii]|nr:hypothetical protein D0Z03_000293 [Galactomyces reessii]
MKNGSAVFQAGGLIILVVEVVKTSFLAGLVPVIVNTVLDEHQFVIDIVAFVGKGDFPRSRLNEKQRGKVLASWVTKKLNVKGIYGVNQGERSLIKSLKFNTDNENASTVNEDVNMRTNRSSIAGSANFESLEPSDSPRLSQVVEK